MQEAKDNTETIDLIRRARTGDDAAVLMLWQQYRPFIASEANKRKQNAERQGVGNVVDVDDLIQEGYFALLRAIEKYDQERGAFLTILGLCLKNSFSEALGIRTQRQYYDPINTALSLDAPLPTFPEMIVAEALPDPEQPIDDLIDGDYYRSLRSIVEDAVQSIKNDRCRQLMEYMLKRDFDCSPVEAMKHIDPKASRSCAYNVFHDGIRSVRKYFRSPRVHREVRLQLAKDFYFPSASVGLRAWKQTGASSVERVVMERDKELRRLQWKVEIAKEDEDRRRTEARAGSSCSDNGGVVAANTE